MIQDRDHAASRVGLPVRFDEKGHFLAPPTGALGFLFRGVLGFVGVSLAVAVAFAFGILPG